MPLDYLKILIIDPKITLILSIKFAYVLVLLQRDIASRYRAMCRALYTRFLMCYEKSVINLTYINYLHIKLFHQILLLVSLIDSNIFKPDFSSKGIVMSDSLVLQAFY